jgi:hypothetical protein
MTEMINYFCPDNCKHLSVTCDKYHTQVKHNGCHPKIKKCSDCIITNLQQQIEDMKKENSKLAEAAIEKPPYKNDLKCCGNCIKRFRYDCPLPTDEGHKDYKYNNQPQKSCLKWQSDNLTAKEREG